MPVVYKTLFDIKLMHEYYLIREDGTTVFDLAAQSDRLLFLEREFADDKPSINDDVFFDFPEGLKAAYEGGFLKLLPSYSGCRVAIRVNAHTMADGSLVYEPFVPLPDNFTVYILINRRTFNIDAFSNGRLMLAYRPVYFFSNAAMTTPRTLPFLTATMPLTDASYPYEQGELSLSAGGKTVQYYRKGAADVWNEVPGQGFAGEGDRLLVAGSFQYTLQDVANLTELNFVLTDNLGNEVASVKRTDANGIEAKTSLNFSEKISSIPLSGFYNVNDYFYTLHVSGNNGYERVHTLIFSNDLLSSDPWAVIGLRMSKGAGDYDIFSPDNFIKRRKDSLGVWTNAPVFEIPVKSRFAYWRFISNKGAALDISPSLVGFVKVEGDAIETLTPRSLAMYSFLIHKDVPPLTDTVYVPNPDVPGIKIGNDGRLFYEVRVPNSELFPEIP